jgi:hypothetical protein
MQPATHRVSAGKPNIRLARLCVAGAIATPRRLRCLMDGQCTVGFGPVSVAAREGIYLPVPPANAATARPGAAAGGFGRVSDHSPGLPGFRDD